MAEEKTFKHIIWGGGRGYGKACYATLSWANKWPSWVRSSEEKMEYIKKHYKTKNMEKKKMTKKEAFEYLKDRKIYVNGKSIEIQMKLFEVGFAWPLSGKTVRFADRPFLYTNPNYLTSGEDMCAFTSNAALEISAEEILAIEIAEEKPNYDEELGRIAQPIREYMRNHNISGRLVVSKSSIAIEDMRFIYPENA